MRRLRGVLLSLMAFVLTSSVTGVVYANTGHPNETQRSHDRLELRIKDQDETWRHRVSQTWVAGNMAPGEDLLFEGSFIGLRGNEKGRISINADYTVQEESPQAGADTGTQTNLFPDRMARELVITRLLYEYGTWQIDGLTGEAAGMTAKQRRSYLDSRGIRWRIPDVDGDGRLTFFDFKYMPLTGLPLPNTSEQGARVVMSVRFAESAGNDLQGDTLNLKMLYTFTPWQGDY